jgi:CPA2 family monovalent cation:H+ antiporter-2
LEEVIVFILTILIASILNILLKKLDLPTAIGYIFTGIIISQFVGGDGAKELEHLSELGIIFLMFTIGLEFSFNELKVMKKQVLLYGSLQVLITATIFAVIAKFLLGFEQKSAIIIASALALSSTAIVLKMLNENGDIHAGYGRKVLGILLFQDLAVIPILILIDVFTKDVEVTTLLLNTSGHMLMFFVLLFVGKFGIDKYLDFSVKSQNQEIFLLAILFTVLASAEVAHLFGFSYSLGAFFAGMLLAESHYKYQIEADLSPFRDLFLGLFFFVVGSGIDVGIVVKNFAIILVLVVVVMAIKSAVIFGVLFFNQKRTAFKSALALSQIGEFALAIFVLAQNNHFINQELSNILATATIFSMILTPFIIKNLTRLADIVFKEPILENKISSVGFKNHVVVCGYGPLGRKVTNSLKQNGFDFVLIEHDLKLYQEALEDNQPVFFGNAAQRAVLESVNIKNATAVLITFHNLEKIRLISQAVLDVSPNAHIVARVRGKEEQNALKDYPIDIVLTVDTLADKMLGELFYCQISEKIDKS